MGIRGLTTFINNRSHLYLENYELHHTSLVIDGNSIACQLYKWHCKCNDCFGGDYDKFANVVLNFFQLLSECNVTPYVILDGGYEQRKLATVISRMKKKIKSAEMLNPASDSSLSVFPLFIRETFVEVLLSLNVNIARCEFEGDTELASLAKGLNCPVLSYDSDFYIFDVPYIPFSTFDMMARKKFVNKSLKESYSYISCKIYKIDNFLKSFGGLDKSKLPLLAVVMGNDYVNRSVFALFFNNLKMQKCGRGQSDQQKRIKSVIVWLQNETVTSAVKKIIARYKLHNRHKILAKIQNAIKGYYYVDSPLFEFFNIKMTDTKYTLPEINIEDLSEDTGDNSLELSEEENSESEDLFNFDVTENQVTKECVLPEVFLHNFKRCIFPPCFMDMKLRDKYYCVPQIEDSSREYAHKVSSDIFMAIHKILTENNDKILNVYARNEQKNVQKYTFPACNINVPSLTEIQGIDPKAHREILLNILNIGSELDETLNLFPESLQLYIISLAYFISRTTFDIPVLYAITLSVLVLHYVDKKLGFVRSAKTFEKKFSKEVKNIATLKKNSQEQPVSEGVFQNISYEDSLFCLQKVMPNFQVDLKIKNNVRLFDRSLVHKMSQFQSIFLHIKYLNSLFLSPFQNVLVADVFNGTLIYNLSKNFSKRSNLTNYLELFLKDCPSVLKTLQFIINNVSQYSKNTEVATCILSMPSKKRNKKRNKIEISIENAAVEGNLEGNHVEEDTNIFDPNNKFSLLSDL